MKIPPADLGYVEERFADLARDVVDAWNDDPGESDGLTPPALQHAMTQLLGILRSCAEATGSPNDPEAPRELRILGEHGLQLLTSLAEYAGRLGLARHARRLRDLCFPFALWVVRCDGSFSSWEPVVDAVAELANRLSDADDLAELCAQLDELLEAGDPVPGRAAERSDQHPWRILVLNRAIVATRSYRPDLMEKAFAAVVEWLPREAPGFFEEAMEQMDVVGYPDPIRAVVETYYRSVCGQRTLH